MNQTHLSAPRTADHPTPLRAPHAPTAARLLLALAILLLVSPAWIGCRPGKTTAVEPPTTFTLISVNDQPVPCTLQHAGATLTVASGTFSIGTDGSCRSRIAFSLPNGSKTVRDVQATSTRSGSKLAMKWKGAGATTGVLDADTFTHYNEGMTFSYRKQPQ